jgi:hypothetical protein
MKLSDLKCRKTGAKAKLYKLADGDGLFLHVYPSGLKRWRMSYRFGVHAANYPGRSASISMAG